MAPCASEDRALDRLDYDAWLLAPLQADPAERAIRLVSQLAGPGLLLLATAATLAALF